MAGIVGMIPATPGGLGLVEASLTGLLVLAEVNSSQALLATLTYRIASYWVPLLAGPIAYGLFKIRYGKRAVAPAAPGSSARLAGPGQVEEVVQDAAEGGHGHGQVTFAGQQEVDVAPSGKVTRRRSVSISWVGSARA